MSQCVKECRTSMSFPLAAFSSLIEVGHTIWAGKSQASFWKAEITARISRRPKEAENKWTERVGKQTLRVKNVQAMPCFISILCARAKVSGVQRDIQVSEMFSTSMQSSWPTYESSTFWGKYLALHQAIAVHAVCSLGVTSKYSFISLAYVRMCYYWS